MPATMTAAATATTTAGALAVLLSILSAMTLLGVAMARYPGGSALDPASVGHSFWFNFLCDLTNDVAVNGQSNRVGSSFARAAMIALSTALGCFWLILPALFRARRRLGFTIRIAGSLSVAGLVTVPLADGLMHVVAVFASSVPALVAGTLGTIGMLRASAPPPLRAMDASPSLSPSPSPSHSPCGIPALLPWLALATVTASLADSVLYARSYLIEPRVIAPALPLFQRVALLCMLALMAAVAIQLLRDVRRDGAR
jgi:hypothetical protein